MTQAPALPNTAYLRRFYVSEPTFVAETGIAVVWKVDQSDGTPAALKIYKANDMVDEGAGFDLMEAQNGQGAALVYNRSDDAVLLEWLDGPTLSDLVRAGQDDTASRILVDTANRLHQMPATPIATLAPLDARFGALFDARFAPDCPDHAVAALRQATALAQRCIAAQSQMRPLHGDLHHDNIKDSARGYLAFDAKGVFGDRHYELSNAFRNPLGSEAFTYQPETLLRRADIFASAYGTDPKTLLTWATAHGALSMAWTHDSTFGAEVAADTPYLDTLLTVLDRL